MLTPRRIASRTLVLAIAGAAALAPAANAMPVTSSDLLSSHPINKCAGDPGAIHEAMMHIAPPMEGKRWVTDGETNYDLCRDLSFATITTEGGTASSPDQLLLFHKGEFVGTGTTVNVPFQRILHSGDDYVTVQYGIPGSANAEVLWQDPITYRWVDGSVVMEGMLAPELEPQ